MPPKDKFMTVFYRTGLRHHCRIASDEGDEGHYRQEMVEFEPFFADVA